MYCSHLYLTVLLVFITVSVPLQGKLSVAQNITHNILQYLQYLKLHDTSTKKCHSKSCKEGSLELPYGKRVFSIPSNITATVPLQEFEDFKTEASGRRIIGGKPISIKDFPFIVSVRQQDSHACGGSYIRARWVLTAAHCLVRELVDSPLKNPAEFTVAMGSATIEGNTSRNKNLQIRKVVMLYPHEDYIKTYALNDIGLIKIDKPFDLTTGVAFAPLPRSADDGEYRVENCSVLGWGTTIDKFSANPSPILLSINIPLITVAKCQTTYDSDRIVSYKIMCAGLKKGGKDACQGDSGGPLVCHHMDVGIVSWGRECGRQNQPGVYTRIDHYLNWINKTIKRLMLKFLA